MAIRGLAGPVRNRIDAAGMIHQDRPMNSSDKRRSAYRALTTINAPLRSPINTATLVECLRLANVDARWRPHIRAYFRDIAIDIIMDMVIDDAVTFDDLSKALTYWDIEETESARWIREMASVTVAETDGTDAGRDRLRPGDRQSA